MAAVRFRRSPNKAGGTTPTAGISDSSSIQEENCRKYTFSGTFVIQRPPQKEGNNRMRGAFPRPLPPPSRVRRRAATRSVAGIPRNDRIEQNPPKSGHGRKKRISSGFAGRWQDVSVPAKAPPFKHTKPRRQPADFRNQTPMPSHLTVSPRHRSSFAPLRLCASRQKFSRVKPQRRKFFPNMIPITSFL